MIGRKAALLALLALAACQDAPTAPETARVAYDFTGGPNDTTPWIVGGGTLAVWPIVVVDGRRYHITGDGSVYAIAPAEVRNEKLLERVRAAVTVVNCSNCPM